MAPPDLNLLQTTLFDETEISVLEQDNLLKSIQQSELTVFSNGMGQDSTALLYLLATNPEFRRTYAPNRLLSLHADTGDEFPETVAHRKHVASFCAEHDIEHVCITPDMGFHGDGWHSLIEQYRTHNTCGSKAFHKSCTQRLKIQPIFGYLESWIECEYGFKAGRNRRAFHEFASAYGKITMIIGIAAGEERRVQKKEAKSKEPAYRRNNVQVVYPLIDLGMDRSTCQQYIASVGQTVPPPSCCMRCPWASPVELLNLARNYPNEYAEWVELEANKLTKFAGREGANHGVWPNKTLPQVLAEAEEKHKDMTADQLAEYCFSHGHNVCSKY